jgi:hypothetical protein
MPTFKLPLSGDVFQAISPWTAFMSPIGSQIGLFNVRIGQSSEPAVEADVLSDVASYGKQLGRIGDALVVLLSHFHPRTPLTEEETAAIDDLKEMLQQIADVKGKHKRKALRPSAHHAPSLDQPPAPIASPAPAPPPPFPPPHAAGQSHMEPPPAHSPPPTEVGSTRLRSLNSLAETRVDAVSAEEASGGTLGARPPDPPPDPSPTTKRSKSATADFDRGEGDETATPHAIALPRAGERREAAAPRTNSTAPAPTTASRRPSRSPPRRPA